MSRSFLARLVSVGLVAAVAATAAVGCSSIGERSLHRIGSSPYEKGSGKVATEARTVTTFHAVSASEGVTVSLTRAATAASVTADDNLLNNVTTEVRDGTLYVGISGNIETSHELRVNLATPAVDAIAADSGATLVTDDLQAAALQAHAGSGATLRGGGTASTLDVSADSGATVDLHNVEATSARVDVSSGSSAFVNAKETVSGRCSGGSTLHVTGGASTAAVSTDISSAVKAE